MFITLEIKSGKRQEFIEITEDIQSAISQNGTREGRCLIFCPHTTAGLFINSNRDPNTLVDLQESIDHIVPTRLDFHHVFDTPSDAAGHIKSTLIGCQLDMIIDDSRVVIGDSQGIFLWEFDGPRARKVYLKISE